jgi:hypothetical protein
MDSHLDLRTNLIRICVLIEKIPIHDYLSLDQNEILNKKLGI